MPVIQLHGKCKQEDHGFMVQAGPGINMRPYSKESYAGRVVQVIEYLPSKCKALSSNPVLQKKKIH
jgi:hypothetical protein